MNLQTYKTTLSRSNQTAVPAYIINKLGLSAGDNLIWNIDSLEKTVNVKVAPKLWGTYLSQINTDAWDGINIEKYIKNLRQDRKFQ
ncbi:MAG: hypothetical protein UR39_C0004G0007 [Candidatus Woesebacteria bacterium GW2011_GWA1_33_30]|uniref:SpoVT-AbrB domain-containing protein n=1 Tax=Candidatus Woesebacteria bacterium GW2011_GWA2_33_28 TaxID=1618561 RepID=A0A0F9ZT72_9BACT|nr:MAG: hypothetical protein UR38_C0004G0066 [Candidatus Woesebacteria bacterium GW2011_GWA2_33_28]KKP48386.1 MAG: hypothetical protein UR39_C0004G0007 [Candidatus Woesebacteria bacterium GW2011_GWA1_33_30]KKP49493.1 MAG: hypothetical protein UR40_C0005G0007 [Microgenomates group bacterium GW2011_GWC1_33_32]KKP52458.1 MAG: hypothetical protein UR44_C0002G0007 [Candidatus Woesebacteria bacterium GW2011_GWB1_33_38]KKP57186.1 MAG: hypothetical protein UR48_C0022G0007 [Microgenomates group bacteriu